MCFKKMTFFYFIDNVVKKRIIIYNLCIILMFYSYYLVGYSFPKHN